MNNFIFFLLHLMALISGFLSVALEIIALVAPVWSLSWSQDQDLTSLSSVHEAYQDETRPQFVTKMVGTTVAAITIACGSLVIFLVSWLLAKRNLKFLATNFLILAGLLEVIGASIFAGHSNSFPRGSGLSLMWVGSIIMAISMIAAGVAAYHTEERNYVTIRDSIKRKTIFE